MIDPRPYTYQYRKPRLNNPTYQSSSVYDSLYHLRIPSKNDMVFTKEREVIQERKARVAYEPVRNSDYNPEMYLSKGSKFANEQRQPGQRQQVSERVHQSLDRTQPRQPPQQPNLRSQSSLQRDITNRLVGNNNPLPGHYERSASNENPRVQSHLSNYGQNLMKSQTFDRFSIFEKQQKGYNIINCYPKSMASSLRVFPKLTLENKLIENGRYFNNH